ncbi:MAG: cellulose biosynthesis (CelD)-like protein, partial [Myxococcales bacterium]|nr:cellulose biosynthesis (CelD)-like protein [Myxococcales bacterium]
FVAPDWLTIYAASLCNDQDATRAGELRLLVAHRAGRLVAALPLLVERRRLAGVPARVLRSLSDDHSQRFDLLLDPACAADATRALVAHLARARDWDAVELQVILDGNSAAQELVDAARAAGFPVGDWPSMVSPYLALPPTVAELDKRLGSKFRGNLRRRAKKLEADVGPVSLERVDGSGISAIQLDAILDEGFALEAAGWKGELGTAIACDTRLRARYKALAHAFAARGQLACYFLRAGTRRVAFHYAIVDADTYYLFKPGFDPALATYGLGHLLVDAVARDLIARNLGELDFLGDDMPWKRDWTDTTRAHSFRYLFAPTARGRALAAWKFRLAPAAKRILARLKGG